MATALEERLAETPAVPVLDLFSLKGQVALVTGPSKGIGQSMALGLSQAGAYVILAQRNVNDTATLDEIKAKSSGPGATIIKCDLADLEEVKGVFAEALKVAPGGKIQILVNNAGMLTREDAVNYPFEEWSMVLDVNLNALWILSQAAGKHMIENRHGRIISTASINSFIGGSRVPAYSASKAALMGVTKAMSNEWAKFNVTVNCICPGSVVTEINSKARQDPEFTVNRTKGIPGGRWGAPADFAGPTVFLASAASNWVTGEMLVVDGGSMAKGPI